MFTGVKYILIDYKVLRARHQNSKTTILILNKYLFYIFMN